MDQCAKMALLHLDPEEAGLNLACGGRTVCPRGRKDDLWWTDILTTHHSLVTQYNGDSFMLVARALRWTIWGVKTSGGQTVGRENNHTPKILTFLFCKYKFQILN